MGDGKRRGANRQSTGEPSDPAAGAARPSAGQLELFAGYPPRLESHAEAARVWVKWLEAARRAGWT